jgi:hypothetical protein
MKFKLIFFDDVLNLVHVAQKDRCSEVFIHHYFGGLAHVVILGLGEDHPLQVVRCPGPDLAG